MNSDSLKIIVRMTTSRACLFSMWMVLNGSPLHAQGSEGVKLAALRGWDIVVAADAIPSEKYAAEEFQKFFTRAAGARLPIVNATDRPDRHIFIGPGEALRSSPIGFGVDDFGVEDLRIIIRDSHIAIAGGRPRGTLYGVYTFLEDTLGVRFLTHDHTHVPAAADDRSIGPLDRIYRPPFVNYRNTGYKTPRQYPMFGVRIRHNAIGHRDPRFGGSSPFYNINHSFYRQVSIDKYGEAHPKYYALIDGKRRAEWQSQLCLTNPQVLQIVIQAVKTSSREIRKPPTSWSARTTGEAITVDARNAAPSMSVKGRTWGRRWPS